jgi:hypothetical protein
VRVVIRPPSVPFFIEALVVPVEVGEGYQVLSIKDKGREMLANPCSALLLVGEGLGLHVFVTKEDDVVLDVQRTCPNPLMFRGAFTGKPIYCNVAEELRNLCLSVNGVNVPAVVQVCARGAAEIERLRAGLKEIVRMGTEPFDRRSVRCREILMGDVLTLDNL